MNTPEPFQIKKNPEEYSKIVTTDKGLKKSAPTEEYTVMPSAIKKSFQNSDLEEYSRVDSHQPPNNEYTRYQDDNDHF